VENQTQPIVGEGGKDGDMLPGQPYPVPEPSPDGGAPDGDGKHRK
jgi:hypothetical protein